VDKTSALAELDRLYQELPPAADDRDFLQWVMELFDIQLEIGAQELNHVPREGPVVVVANHPFGAIEGVIMAHLLRSLRDDVRIMANHFLRRFEEIAHLFIDVDPFGGAAATRRNIKPLREAIRWVQGGGLLMMFPAGEVSHINLPCKAITDPAWSPTVASIARAGKATVVPVFIHGHNSLMFHIAGLVHPRLRTALLPRELLNKAHRRIRLRIGAPIADRQLARCENDAEVTAYLRMRTYLLDECARPPQQGPAAAKTPTIPAPEPIIDAVPARLLQAEVDQIPAAQTLVVADQWRVFYAHAGQIPWLLQEIGRLREITFRAVGEGTGRRADIDLFDDYYLHLFLWNAETTEVAGAYRVGRADAIVQKHGMRGLYTHTLFHYKGRLLNELLPALELGRSFVREEYQRSFTALMLLWKGIGEFVVRHPRYRMLFGPVSISNEYQPQSRALLVDYLRRTRLAPQYARYVRPRRPFRMPVRGLWHASDLAAFSGLEAVDELIAGIEPDGKGTPVLVRHYLRLGGKFLGFNVDAQFGDTLDGLVMVDLSASDPRLLARYMGKAGAQRFLEFHRHDARQSAA
jgi:putative hemolysin